MASLPLSISKGDLTATVIPNGARLADLRLKGHERPLVLRHEKLDDFASDKYFMGAVIGRYGNRIDAGTAIINGNQIQLEKNEDGLRHLHGGSGGFDRRTWVLEQQSENLVRLSVTSPDGEAGFPGELKATAEYSIQTDNVLRLDLTAISNKDTIVNLCHHPYFHFGTQPGLKDHKLKIFADEFLPSNEALVPTGEIACVYETPFDFTQTRVLTDVDGGSPHRFNNTYCYPRADQGSVTHGATLSSPYIKMELWTSQPGVHLYNGYKLDGSTAGFNGEPLSAFAGVCLEAQNWPDSPNNDHFPNCQLNANDTYFQRTEYRFL